MKRRVGIALAVFVFVGLFLAARNAASWRPQLLAADSVEALMFQSHSAGTTRLTPESNVIRSRRGRWVAIRNDDGPIVLWDKERRVERRDVGRGLPVFSPDERLLAVITPGKRQFIEATPTYVRVSIEDLQTHRVTQWPPILCSTVSRSSYSSQVTSGAFSADGATFTAASGTVILRWEVKSGRLVSQTQGLLFSAETGISLFAQGNKVWVSTRGGSLMLQSGLEKCEVYDVSTGNIERVSNRGGAILPDERFYWNSNRYAGPNFCIRRVSDNHKVLDRPGWETPVFTPNGLWMATKRALPNGAHEVQLLEVGSWRVAAKRTLPAFNNSILNDADHLLTLSQQGVYRWRLR